MKCSQVLCVAICAVFVYSAYAATLKEGWVPLKGGKYIIKFDAVANWTSAVKDCKSQGYDLMAIETETEHNEVVEIFGHLITNRFWLAGTDLGSNGTFYWSTTGANFDFTAWHTGEPSGTNVYTGISEDCVQYWNRNGTILWNDGPCNMTYNYACEAPICTRPLSLI